MVPNSESEEPVGCKVWYSDFLRIIELARVSGAARRHCSKTTSSQVHLKLARARAAYLVYHASAALRVAL
jgi:uncharacterized membrane protein YgdD (TMEM256/DUF423 family)